MPKTRSLTTAAALALAFAASACGSVNPAGLIAASRLDPLNTPPSGIALAVGVPDTLRLADGDAEFRIAFQGGTAASTIFLEEVAPLAVAAPGDRGPRPNAADEIIYVASIAAEDAPRIAAIQQEIRTLRANGVEGEGSLTVSVVGGCFVDAMPSQIEVSTWLQTDPSDGFVPLTRRQDVARAIGAREAEMLRARLARCPEEE
jgi:hypothetical protein